MPVEIRELVIRATVRSKPAETVDDMRLHKDQGITEADKSEIVRTAVEQVLRILKTSKER